MHLGSASAPVPGWEQVVENLEGAAGITDRLDRLQRPPPGEDRQASEEEPLVVREQPVAPIQGGP